MKLNRNGFTVAEGLLMAIAVTLIAFVGFYVSNANKESSKIQTESAASQSKQAEKGAAEKRYLRLTELGVKIPVDDSIKDVNYIFNDTVPDEKSATLTSVKFTKAVEQCRKGQPAANNPVPIMQVVRYDGQYDPNAAPAQVYSDGLLKQFPEFYLEAVNFDGGYCEGADSPEAEKVTALYTVLKSDLKAAFKNAEAIQ